MINSMLDDDLYKFTMQWAIMNKFPNEHVEYTFFNRGDQKMPDNFSENLKKEIQKLTLLKLTDGEEQFLIKKTPFLPQLYIDFLKGYRYNPDEVSISQDDGKLSLKIKGFWYRTILWEVKILAIISELYFKETKQISKYNDLCLTKMNDEKANRMCQADAKFSDFGTRRRFSSENHDKIFKSFTKFDSFMGTSNLYFAKKYDLTPIGTHAHEWFMFHAANYGYKMANKMSLVNWSDVYHGDLGIALTDTFTTDAFFKIFDKKMGRLFDGVRHDSGDPYVFAEKTIEHYNKLNIDPRSKAIIFSDNLNIDKAIKLNEAFKDRILVRFGIGTHLSNDVGVKALSIVIKMTKAEIHGEWFDTIKLSDDVGKETGGKLEMKIAKETLLLTNDT